MIHYMRMRDIFFESHPKLPSTLVHFFKIEAPKEEKSEEKQKEANKKRDKKKKDNKEKESAPAPSIASEFGKDKWRPIYPEKSVSAKKSLLKNIFLNGWNPVPEQRKLQGELFYLSVATNEGKRFHLTASEKGFFANKSDDSKFDPQPLQESSKPRLLLVDALADAIPHFESRVSSFLSELKDPSNLDSDEAPVSYQWISPRVPHLPSPGMGENLLRQFFGFTENRGVLRDWNHELQSLREQKAETMEEAIKKNHFLNKVSVDFSKAVVQGARMVVDGEIVSVNSEEDPSEHIFIFNNIFFTRAVDSKDQMKEFGGDRAARKMYSNEVACHTLFHAQEIKGLSTLALAVVDYKGTRVVAQSMLPGILQNEGTNEVLYGSLDFGKEIKSSDECVEEFKQFDKLGVEPCNMKDDNGNIGITFF